MRKILTDLQVQILRPKYERKKATETEWAEALILLGIENGQIVGGDLSCEEPYLLVQYSESVSAR